MEPQLKGSEPIEYDNRRTFFASRGGLFFIDNASGRLYLWKADGSHEQITPDPVSVESYTTAKEAKP